MQDSHVDTLVVGAGPYGLSVSAHLRGAGIDHMVVGKTMDFWSRKMPRGMCLRSPVRASSMSDPEGALTLEAFSADTGTTLGPPIPIESFLAYGQWFADRAGVEVDPRMVEQLSADDGGFAARLEDGETVRARNVVLAAGSEPFQWTPPEFRGLPSELVSHASDHGDLGVFAGKDLVVLGAGQAGIEYAAIASEQGARVRVVLRAERIRWLTRSAKLHTAPLLSQLLYAPADVGPAGLSRVVSVPSMFRMLPYAWRAKATKRCTRPAAAAWLIERTRNIPIHTGRGISSIETNGRVQIALEGGDRIEADHLLLATGYRVDLSGYTFVAPELLDAVRTKNGFPVLGPGLASSIPGLYMVGWPATGTFGPLMRHVVGSEFAATAVAARLSGSRAAAPALRPVSVSA